MCILYIERYGCVSKVQKKIVVKCFLISFYFTPIWFQQPKFLNPCFSAVSPCFLSKTSTWWFKPWPFWDGDLWPFKGLLVTSNWGIKRSRLESPGRLLFIFFLQVPPNSSFALEKLRLSSALCRQGPHQLKTVERRKHGEHFCLAYHGNPQPSFLGVINHILGLQNLHFSWFWGPRVLTNWDTPSINWELGNNPRTSAIDSLRWINANLLRGFSDSLASFGAKVLGKSLDISLVCKYLNIYIYYIYIYRYTAILYHPPPKKKRISWNLMAIHLLVTSGWLSIGWWTNSLHRKWLEITKHPSIWKNGWLSGTRKLYFANWPLKSFGHVFSRSSVTSFVVVFFPRGFPPTAGVGKGDPPAKRD